MRWIILGLFAVSTAGAGQTATFAGAIIDADCARGGHASMRMGETDAECAKACVLTHDSAYLLDDGANVYRLSDQKAAERPRVSL